MGATLSAKTSLLYHHRESASRSPLMRRRPTSRQAQIEAPTAVANSDTAVAAAIDSGVAVARCAGSANVNEIINAASMIRAMPTSPTNTKNVEPVLLDER